MSSVNNPSRVYCTPQGGARDGCPCKMTPYYQVLTEDPDPESRSKVIHKYTTMQLSHQTAEGVVKNSLSLDGIHHQLEAHSLLLEKSGSSNILVSSVTFDCLITKADGEQVRDYIDFELRIPGANVQGEEVFSYDLIKKTYGNQTRLYEVLKHFYDLGRLKANPEDLKHGHEPEYDPTSSKHDQYIRHTEQLVVAYLALPEASEMLSNRLRITIRGKYPGASEVKVYNMGLHMHSTKTCCAPCEYSLVGLMNKRLPFAQNGQNLGFLRNFQRIASRPNEQLSFTFPENSYFRLLVTVSTSDTDAHHQKEPSYKTKKLSTEDEVAPYVISVKDPSSSKYIFSTMLKIPFNRNRLPTTSDLRNYTVGISGSRATSGSPGTIEKVKKTKKEEIEALGKKLSFLQV